MDHITIKHIPKDHLLFRASDFSIRGVGLTSLICKHAVISSFNAKDFLVDWDDSLFAAEDDASAGDANAGSDNKDKQAISKAVIRDFNLQNITLILREEGEERHRYNEVYFKGRFAFSLRHGFFSSLERDNSIHVDTLGFYLSDDRYRFSLADFSFSQEVGASSLRSMEFIPSGGYELIHAHARLPGLHVRISPA